MQDITIMKSTTMNKNVRKSGVSLGKNDILLYFVPILSPFLEIQTLPPNKDYVLRMSKTYAISCEDEFA